MLSPQAIPHKLFSFQLVNWGVLEKSSTSSLNNFSSTEICQQFSLPLYRLLAEIFFYIKYFHSKNVSAKRLLNMSFRPPGGTEIFIFILILTGLRNLA